MGFADAFSAEDRVQVKFSDFYKLMKSTAQMELLANAVKCEVPYQHIREMLTGQNDLLTGYKDTGMMPEQIVEMERLYKGMCEKAKDLTKQNEVLLQENKELKTTVAAAPIEEMATQMNESDASEKPAETSEEETPTGGDCKKKEQKARKPIDIGKIVALKNAGWKIKDIADEMRMEPSAVSNALWRYNKSLEDKKDE